MSNFWDQRYATVEYAYGTKPNSFYSEQLKKLKPGKILFPAEGEGRNAVYAATQGWQVFAFDLSTEGKRKALLLANENNVTIDYQIAGYEDINFEKGYFDVIVLIFAHIHPLKRIKYHRKLASFLKPGGTLILEGFSKRQINNNTGGPRDVNMLYSVEELQEDFNFFSTLNISETDTQLDEGPFHCGIAAVVRATGKK